MTVVLPTAVVIGVLCILFVRLLIPLSWSMGLVDQADARKRHRGAVPLVGGLAIVSAMVLGVGVVLDLPQRYLWVGLSVGSVTLVGAVDDRRPLRALHRLLAHLGAGLLIATAGEIQVTSIGNLLGRGTIDLGLAAMPLTVIAIAGLANAFNMIDGIDGLAGVLSLVAIGSLLILIPGRASEHDLALLGGLAAAVSVFLVFNLSSGAMRIFLGDAGSTFLGISIAVALIRASQMGAIRPTTALWLIGVPLMDLALTVGRRVAQRRPCLIGDRRHLHHVLLRRGLSDRSALGLVAALALVLAAVGILIEANAIPDAWSFTAFLLVFAIYVISVERLRFVEVSRSRSRRRRPVDHWDSAPVDVVESPLHREEAHLGEQSV